MSKVPSEKGCEICPQVALKCIPCPKARADVRASLFFFAFTNFLAGMGVFMFVFCSSAPDHIEHLNLLLTNYPEFVEHMNHDHK